MNRLGFAGNPLVMERTVVPTGGTEKPVESTLAELFPGKGIVYSQAGGITCPVPKPDRWGEANVTLTPLQRMIQEILDPLALHQRSVKEWRSLYKSWFAWFAPQGNADETERGAWAIATNVFNTNLVVAGNRTNQVIPMTFQDFVDAVDSFRHNGLREGAQQDIAWQPKKILLLMASMIGRILAGWQADVSGAGEFYPESSSFRNYLITENRKAKFLGWLFDYESCFSILEYRAVGLKPLLHAFPHLAHALMENGIHRCEICIPQVAENPPYLRAHFLRPLRAPTPLRTISTLNLVLLRKPLPLSTGCLDAETQNSYFEGSQTVLETLVFEPSETPEIRVSKIESLFELAVTEGLLLGGPHRADASTAARIGKTLGRTQAEQFVIERFFALGIRTGHGNESWLEHASGEPPQRDPDKVKKSRKQFALWKNTCRFFLQAGQPQAADIPGSRMRQEALQPIGSDLFLSLLNTPVYAPLMGVFLTADAQGKWAIEEPELHAFARSLHGGTGKVLMEAGGAIGRCVDSFPDQETKGTFLFECAVGILLSATNGHHNPRRLTSLTKAKDILCKNYERAFGISLSTAPSVLPTNPAENAAQLGYHKKKLQDAELTIMSLLAEPFNRKVSEPLREALATLPKLGDSLAAQPAPRLHLENPTKFEASITGLCAWIKSRRQQMSSATMPGASQLLTGWVEVRALAEAGDAANALVKASALHSALSESKQQALAPFLTELSWSCLQLIAQQLHQGNKEKATTLAESAMAIVEGTPSRDDFKSRVQDLFAPKLATQDSASPEPSVTVSTSEPPGLRARQAEALLRDYAEELSLSENQLEHEFLKAVKSGSEVAFRRKEKLRNRLQRRTRWGGREPYKTTLELLDLTPECNA